jgi:hypothetical protein
MRGSKLPVMSDWPERPLGRVSTVVIRISNAEDERFIGLSTQKRVQTILSDERTTGMQRDSLVLFDENAG